MVPMTAPVAGDAAVQIAQEMGLTVRGRDEIAVAQSAIAGYTDDLSRRLADVRRREDNDRRFGPFYTTAKTMQVLGCRNRQSLSNMIGRHTILRVRTADGRNAFPALQFDVPARRVVPGLRPVLQTLLPPAATAWTVLDWLVAPMPGLAGRRPIDAIQGGDADAVLALAGQDAAAWAR